MKAVIVSLLSAALLSHAAVLLANDLTQALRSTMNHHPALTGKQAEVQARQFENEAAEAQYYPSLSAQAAVQQGGQPATVRARQPLWSFGRIESTIDFTAAGVDVEKADLVRVGRDLLEKTAVAYGRVLTVKTRIVAAQKNVQQLGQFLARIERREQAQLASLADVRLARSRLIQARAQLAQYHGDLRVAKTELWALTQQEIRAEHAVEQSMLQLEDLSRLEARAQQHSAELVWKHQQVELAKTEVAREKTSQMPTVYLQADRYINQSSNADKNHNIGVVFEGDLESMGFSAKGNSQAADARLQAAIADLAAARTEVIREVNNLYANRALQQGLLADQRQTIAELDSILASYQRQYVAGHKSWLEVLNMQRELFQQRLQYIQAQSDWLIYTLRIQALVGELDALIEE